MYFMLKTKRFKRPRNQILHLMDRNGVTYCQTENMKRKKPPEFIEIADAEKRPVCRVCIRKRDYIEFGEPDLSVLMGERTDTR